MYMRLLRCFLLQGPNSGSKKDGSSLSPPAKGGKGAKHKQKQRQQQQQQVGGSSSSGAVDVASWKALSDLLARKNDRINHLQVCWSKGSSSWVLSLWGAL